MNKVACLIVLLAGVAAPASSSLAQPLARSALTDEQIVNAATLVSSGPRIDLYQHGLSVDSQLLPAAERALSRMEEALGRKFEEVGLGPRLRIYVSSATTVSHVWRGYGHPDDPRPFLFLNSRVARLAAGGLNATYAHEMAHLLTWRFHSHSLREGFADWLAHEVHPGVAVGPTTAGYDQRMTIPAEVDDYVGTARPAPAPVTNDLAYRQAYYYASYRLVKLLIERKGMATFLELYAAPSPVDRYMELYGESRLDLVAASRR